MNKDLIKKYLPLAAAVAACLYFGYHMRPRSSPANDFNYRDFGRVLVIDGGRYKPLDTVARTSLMMITHRQYFYDADAKVYYPATKWLLDAMTTPIPNTDLVALFPNGARKMPAWGHKVFRIENDKLIEFLQLERREGLRYSIDDLVNGGNIQAFFAQGQAVRHKDPKQLDLFDAKVHELETHLRKHIQISNHSVPLSIPTKSLDDDQWLPFADAHAKFGSLARELPDGIEAQTYGAIRQMLVAYDEGNPGRFNSLVAKQLEFQQSNAPELMRAKNVELFFNEFSPFYHCLEVYAVLALICCLAWLSPEWTRPIQRACFAAMGVSFAVHLSGLIIRMYLQDRLFVFVTNLYSSAVFIGLGSVFFCMIAEQFYKNGIATIVGSVGGFLSLIIAHMLSLSGDTLEMMQAVLDTNFWLATHVTCITLGYVAAFVAGLMGIAYIFLGMFTDKLRKDGSANLTRMTYGVLCAGMFLSFVGTVLGGLWADYSWGRFWGWDPKENGALLIVIWIALILHARWGGMVKHRGIAVLSVLGIVVTSWSWFGTNFLGVGLHSYGFRQGAMASLIMVDLGFLAIAGLGLVPLNMWQSFKPPVHPNAAAPRTV